MRHLATLLVALFAFSVPALATVPDILINGGTMDYDHLGAINGHFGSVGSLVSAPATEGTAATTYVLDGIDFLVVTGALEDGANFVDGAVLIIASNTGPVGPGTYPLDTVTALLVIVDDAVGWTPPADLFNTNWTNELASIVAAGKYGSVSGTVTVNSVSPSLISGTFSAAMVDPSTLDALTVTNGTFNVEGTTDTDAATWGAVKALYK